MNLSFALLQYQVVRLFAVIASFYKPPMTVSKIPNMTAGVKHKENLRKPILNAFGVWLNIVEVQVQFISINSKDFFILLMQKV